MKRILGLDQATSLTGYSVFEDGNLVKHGKLKLDGDVLDRIAEVQEWIRKVVEVLTADGAELHVGVEDIQMQVNYESKNKVYGEGNIANVTTFKTLAWLQGVVLVELKKMNIKTTVVPASAWKSTCGIKGKDRTAQKQNCQKYVQEKFGIKATQDECDAICLGEHLVQEEDKVVNWD